MFFFFKKIFKHFLKANENFQFFKDNETALIRIATKIQTSTIEELKNGESRLIMSELQKLNRVTEKVKNVDSFVKESRKNIRKLIFIFAR